METLQESGDSNNREDSTNLTTILTENGYTRADLVRASNVSDKTIQRLVYGADNVRENTKYKILEGLNLLLRAKNKPEKTYEGVFPKG